MCTGCGTRLDCTFAAETVKNLNEEIHSTVLDSLLDHQLLCACDEHNIHQGLE